MRFRQDLDILEAPKFTFIAKLVVLPRREHDIHSFAEPGIALARFNPEDAVLGRIKTAPGTPVDASTRQLIQQSDLFGEAHG